MSQMAAKPYCTFHFEGLAHAMRHRGMAALIRPERAAVFVDSWLKGTAPFYEFDPLIVSSLEVRSKCMQLGVPNEGCPLCCANKYVDLPDCDDVWTAAVADLMLHQARLRGLVRA